MNKKLVISTLLCALLIIISGRLNAQVDGYIYEGIEKRTITDEGLNYSTLAESEEYAYLFKGFVFENFQESVETGFEFGSFGFEPENVPLGNGLVLLSCLGVFYARKRNKKEDQN